MSDAQEVIAMGSVRVEHEPASAALVRHRLAEELAQHGVTAADVDEAVLVASELVGNAIRHTESGLIDVAWTLDVNGLMVTVTDTGDGRPVTRYPSAEEPNGRGLTIVNALASAWGVEPIAAAGPGKRVWARMAVHRIG